LASIPLSPNHLLASLPAEDFELLRPHLRSVEMVQGVVLAQSGEKLTHAYFPHSGIISLVVNLAQGEMVESAMIGRDSVFGASASLDGLTSLSNAIVQLPGFASILGVGHLRTAADQSASFRTSLIRHEQVLFVQAQQSAACNASHSLESRLSRWLLRTRDLSGSDTLLLTQEFLAEMLGVRRNAVSIVANTLQSAGFIQYNRGHIRITNLVGLKETTCECYETVRDHYARLLCSD
jgi:CRP-like cAMP-binding protein